MFLEDEIKIMHCFLCFMNGFYYACGFGFGNGTTDVVVGCRQGRIRCSVTD